MRCSSGFVLLCAAVAFGCQSPSAVSDPFVRSRVPPPATGNLSAAPPATYGAVVAPPGAAMSTAPMAPITPPSMPPPTAGVPAAPQYSAPAVPTYQAPPPPARSPTAPAGSPPYAPPGGSWAPTSSTLGPPINSVNDRNAMQQEVRPLAESARAGTLAAAAGDGAGEGATPGQMSVEPVNKINDSAMSPPLRGANDAAIQPVSYNAPPGAPPRVVRGAYTTTNGAASGQTTATRPITSGAGPADRGATYGYDANYAWLQGQLEYTQATRQWKLRYIPLDGMTDKYGGSVVLAPSPALNGMKAGAFVSVKGQIAANPAGQGSYAPLYQVTSVDRLSD